MIEREQFPSPPVSTKHEHLCPKCFEVDACFLDCAVDVVDGRGLGGSEVCEDCAMDARNEEEKAVLEAKRLKHALLWQHLAIVVGLNELAKRSTVFGEKVFLRIARDHAEEEYKKLGGADSLKRDENDRIVFVLSERLPHVVFTERDIEGMRAAVAKHDAERTADCSSGLPDSPSASTATSDSGLRTSEIPPAVDPPTEDPPAASPPTAVPIAETRSRYA